MIMWPETRGDHLTEVTEEQLTQVTRESLKDDSLATLNFKDALDRRFAFPWRHVSTWKVL